MLALVAERDRASQQWRELRLRGALKLDPDHWRRATAQVATPFQSLDWYRAWSSVARPEALAAVRVLADVTAHAAAGIVPLALVRRHIGPGSFSVLTWASEDFGCPDHLDLALADEAAVESFAERVITMPWDFLELGNLGQEAPRARQLARALARRGYRVATRAAEPCPRLVLPATWDGYLASQSATRRQTIRRKERKLEKEHRVVVREHDTASFDDGWQTLSALHSDRWGGATAFSPRVAEMHRVFAKALAAQGALWLTTLELDGLAAAAWYGFAWGDTVYFFQSGRATEQRGGSVGQVLMGKMIRRAIEQGFRHFDFLRGDEPYKADWTEDLRTTWELIATRPGTRGIWPRACRSLDRARRRARTHARQVLSKIAGASGRHA